MVDHLVLLGKVKVKINTFLILELELFLARLFHLFCLALILFKTKSKQSIRVYNSCLLSTSRMHDF